MGFVFDHAVIAVESLSSAMARFTAAGFTVTPGGRHEELPTENALIILADGSYLELLALRDPAMRQELLARRTWRDVDPIGRRFLPTFLGTWGVADLALRAESPERVVATARLRGAAMDGPISFGRERPDGQRMACTLVLPMSRELPYLVHDVTPHSRRVPDDPACVRHANGASAVVGLELAVGDVDEALGAWRAMLGAMSVAREGDTALMRVAGLDVRLLSAAGGRPGPRRLVLRTAAATGADALADLRIALESAGA